MYFFIRHKSAFLEGGSGVAQLDAEGVIWHSSPTKSTAESQSATKKYNLIIEIRKNFYLKTAFTINS